MLIFVVRVAIVVAAAFGARSRNPRIHVFAILILLVDLSGLWLAHSVVMDPRAYVIGGPLVIWLISGPLLPAFLLPGAIMVAPAVVLPGMIAALAMGGLIWRPLWRRSRRRVWTVVAALGGAVAALAVLEVGVEATMRIDAARIPNSCGFWRTNVLVMIPKSGSSYASGRHGGLHDGATAYSWSFRHGGWVVQYECAPSNTVGCSCGD